MLFSRIVFPLFSTAFLSVAGALETATLEAAEAENGGTRHLNILDRHLNILDPPAPQCCDQGKPAGTCSTVRWCNEDPAHCEGPCDGVMITDPHPREDPLECCDQGKPVGTCSEVPWCNMNSANCEGPCAGEMIPDPYYDKVCPCWDTNDLDQIDDTNIFSNPSWYGTSCSYYGYWGGSYQFNLLLSTAMDVEVLDENGQPFLRHGYGVETTSSGNKCMEMAGYGSNYFSYYPTYLTDLEYAACKKEVDLRCLQLGFANPY
jgi:hypothetical protein